MKFSDIPANPSIKRKLIQTIQDQRVSHAQLFFGPEGSWKLALAIAYAQLINCTAPKYPVSPPIAPKSPKGDLLPLCGMTSPQPSPLRGGSKSPLGDLGAIGGETGYLGAVQLISWA